MEVCSFGVMNVCDLIVSSNLRQNIIARLLHMKVSHLKFNPRLFEVMKDVVCSLAVVFFIFARVEIIKVNHDVQNYSHNNSTI